MVQGKKWIAPQHLINWMMVKRLNLHFLKLVYFRGKISNLISKNGRSLGFPFFSQELCLFEALRKVRNGNQALTLGAKTIFDCMTLGNPNLY